jgi:CheY-like chemotaxis protein/HPt (histidine-containing phosphotransfer) domain-containing protein
MVAVKGSQLYNALLKALAETSRMLTSANLVRKKASRPHPVADSLAEDNTVNQKVALRLLDQLGYRAEVASNGREALEALERQPYDVVLMDVQMPELDGLDASRRICARWPADVRPRIIAMTANAMPEDREACFAAGMDDYVAKPIRPNELAAALSRARPRGVSAAWRAEAPGVTLDESAVESLRALGGEEFLAEVIETFLAEAPTLLATLHGSLEKEDADELRRAAHTLKSNGSTLGAPGFSELCGELEQVAKRGELQGAAPLVDRIERDYHPLREALAALRSPAAS